MSLIICPGIHPTQFTQDFLAGLGNCLKSSLVVPTHLYPAYSPLHLFNFLTQELGSLPDRPALLLIAFSAGVVGGIGAARQWQRSGGKIKGFIAMDGWGVPLWGDFPIHCLSHDAFTHWTSIRWGQAQDSFYAEPGVEHLQLWRSPQTVQGWCIPAASGRQSSQIQGSHPERIFPLRSSSTAHLSGDRILTTAAEFLHALLTHYEEIPEQVV